MRASFVAICAVVALCLNSGCSKGEAQSSGQAGNVRIATYNIQWFSEDANPRRVANLKSVIGKIHADVIGLQEIESKRALTQIFDRSWSFGMANDPDEHQELAIAVKKPFVLVSSELLFDGPQFEHAFPDGRDVLRCVVQTPTSAQVIVYVVHMKSRLGGRRTTDPRREAACGLLAAYIKSRPDESNVVILGDFNDAPDDRSVNILETGDLNSRAGKVTSPRLFVNLCDPLNDKDYATEGLNHLGSNRSSAIVPGARAENARLRGQDYDFPDDVRVRQTLFDQILVSPQCAKNARVNIHVSEQALTGSPGRTSRQDDQVTYMEKGDLASDHLPVVAELSVR